MMNSKEVLKEMAYQIEALGYYSKGDYEIIKQGLYELLKSVLEEE